MKNKSLLFCVTMLSIPLLVGCNKNNKIQLKIGFWPLSTDKEDVSMYTAWKANFERDFPQYEIVADHYEYSKDTIIARARSGTLPTVFQTWFTEPESLVKSGFIRSIQTELEEVDWLDKMDNEMKNALTFNDEIYGIPRDGYGLGLLINLKTFYDNGLIDKGTDGKYILYDNDNNPLYPTTFDEIIEAGKEIIESSDTKAIYICSTNKNGGWQFSNYAWNFGASLTKVENGQIKANLNCEEAVAALDWIKELKNEELLLNQKSVEYEGWYNKIGDQVAMAVVGNDVIKLAATQAHLNMNDFAFVPMPSANGNKRYSLYGGTPFVFAKNATDEQVKGVLKFFDYIGRSPNINDISKEAMRYGFEVAKRKNQPIMKEISPWINDEYVEFKNELLEEYVNVDMRYYNEFFDSIDSNKHPEVEYLPQEMYEILDNAIAQVFDNPSTCNTLSILTTCNAQYQEKLDEAYNNK